MSVITSVQMYEVGPSQNATTNIIGGGVGYTDVTVSIQSQLDSGFYVVLDVYGQ